MKKLNQFLFFAIGAAILSGCSGSSSSGTANNYSGIYNGTSTITLRGLGTTYTESLPLRIVVGVEGRVDVSTPGSTGATCSGPQVPMVLVGNKASGTATNVSCTSQDLRCTVSGTISYTFASDSASQTGTAVMNCNVGQVDVTYSGFVRKTG
jgi:hypothetical protein|tara:strand:+ start:159 stop:614 length:456 start_codon:yes stop_codon:yes gene_type:complete